MSDSETPWVDRELEESMQDVDDSEAEVGADFARRLERILRQHNEALQDLLAGTSTARDEAQEALAAYASLRAELWN